MYTWELWYSGSPVLNFGPSRWAKWVTRYSEWSAEYLKSRLILCCNRNASIESSSWKMDLLELLTLQPRQVLIDVETKMVWLQSIWWDEGRVLQNKSLITILDMPSRWSNSQLKAATTIHSSMTILQITKKERNLSVLHQRSPISIDRSHNQERSRSSPLSDRQLRTVRVHLRI